MEHDERATEGLDHERMRVAARQLGDRVGERRVAVAESCTGGRIAAACSSIEGAGRWFVGGIVAYDAGVKHELLGVEPGPLVTPTVAEQMARGAAARFGAEITLSTTGATGPDPLDGAPPGTVVVGWCVDGRIGSVVLRFEGDPIPVAREAAHAALIHLASVLDAGSS